MTPAILPQPRESLPGFLRRLASAQSYSDVSEFLSGFGLTYGRPMIEALNTVELRLGVPPGSIAAMAPRAGAERPALEWRFQRNACAPVCPVCIAEKRPHHEAWGHGFVTACPVHEVALVGTCPLCHEPFQPDKGSYGSCACGCPLDRNPAEPAAQWEIAVSALIAGEIHPSGALLPPARPGVPDTGPHRELPPVPRGLRGAHPPGSRGRPTCPAHRKPRARSWSRFRTCFANGRPGSQRL